MGSEQQGELGGETAVLGYTTWREALTPPGSVSDSQDRSG